jgi:hypothetical protein
MINTEVNAVRWSILIKYSILRTILWSNLHLIQIQSKLCGHLTTHLIAIPWLPCHVPDIIRCLCKMSSSIIIIIITVDHLVRSGRAVQYRGCAYSNRFYTLLRLRTLPTLWSTDLMIPFGWTSIAPTKPAWPVTLPSYHRQSHSLLESSPRWPCVLMTPATVVAKQNCPKRGRVPKQLNWAHRIIAAYRARVARAHNPPSLEVPVGEHAIRPSQGRPIPTNVVAQISPDRWL